MIGFVVRLFRILRAHPRLFLGVAIGLLVGVLLPDSFRGSTRFLIAWNIGTWIYFITTAWLIFHATEESIRRRAKSTDEGKFLVLVLTSFAAIASIGAIIMQLAAAQDLSGLAKGLHVGLAVATILSAWFFIHLTYALHYAHEYFDEYFAEPGRPRSERGGLRFPGTENPDYYDFLYFSYVIGVASQTADVDISSHEMRRVAVSHCVLAFFFNSAVLALTINIAAGLI
ncbi:DUF1345 domain-containing protein [Methylocapsa aurea]|uniref:DUF1345 domain-containing protein n=1 Tax=Methylocapsa aurea TaxID=663610 RepID=UPI000561E266|nr:DUF1345 domain-containing protein [Methylocapsa aurea]